MSCTLRSGANTAQVCVNDTDVVYRFGRAGKAPDLELTTPVSTVDYVPWPGIGRTIWESVAFENGAFRYEIGTGFSRRMDDDDPEIPVAFGVISVTENGESIATLKCDKGTVDWGYGGGLFDAKKAQNLCWKSAPENKWISCPTK